jgi:hypothetical protein
MLLPTCQSSFPPIKGHFSCPKITLAAKIFPAFLLALLKLMRCQLFSKLRSLRHHQDLMSQFPDLSPCQCQSRWPPLRVKNQSSVLAIKIPSLPRTLASSVSNQRPLAASTFPVTDVSQRAGQKNVVREEMLFDDMGDLQQVDLVQRAERQGQDAQMKDRVQIVFEKDFIVVIRLDTKIQK